MGWLGLIGAPAAAFIGVALASRALLPLLLSWHLVDHPNHRSSHAAPTPRGGGIAVMAVLLVLALPLALLGGAPGLLPLLGAAAALALVSLADDRRSLGVVPRIAAQGAAAALAVWVAAQHWPPPPAWAPALLLAPLAWLALLWFVNLFNFMDGIDGITGTQCVAIGLGAALVVASHVQPVGEAAPLAGAALQGGLLIAAAAAGFLTINWSPARVFLGDVGSIPLGFLCGALLLALAALGHPAAALILPAYSVLDATVTLLRRWARGEKLTQAHRSHAYQKAALSGLGHGAICRRIAGLNLALVGLALASPFAPLLTLAAGYGLAGGLYLAFDRRVAAAAVRP